MKHNPKIHYFDIFSATTPKSLLSNLMLILDDRNLHL